MLSNVIDVLSYTDQSARSCRVILSMVRLIPDNAKGKTPERFPGLRPLPCTVALPAWQALQEPVTIDCSDASRVEQERRRHHVLAAGEDRADVVDAGVAWRVEHTVGIQHQDLVGIGRR